jgi:hypothetical protein
MADGGVPQKRAKRGHGAGDGEHILPKKSRKGSAATAPLVVVNGPRAFCRKIDRAWSDEIASGMKWFEMQAYQNEQHWTNVFKQVRAGDYILFTPKRVTDSPLDCVARVAGPPALKTQTDVALLVLKPLLHSKADVHTHLSNEALNKEFVDYLCIDQIWDLRALRLSFQAGISKLDGVSPAKKKQGFPKLDLDISKLESLLNDPLVQRFDLAAAMLATCEQ